MKETNTTPTSKKQDKAAAEVLKIGIDVHKAEGAKGGAKGVNRQNAN